MAIEIPFLGPVLSIILVILIVYFVLNTGKKLILFLINSFIGLVLLVLVNLIPGISIQVNTWSILVAGIGGIVGVIILILLSYLGIAF